MLDTFRSTFQTSSRAYRPPFMWVQQMTCPGEAATTVDSVTEMLTRPSKSLKRSLTTCHRCDILTYLGTPPWPRGYRAGHEPRGHRSCRRRHALSRDGGTRVRRTSTSRELVERALRPCSTCPGAAIGGSSFAMAASPC